MKDFTRKKTILVMLIIAIAMFGYYQYSSMEPFSQEQLKNQAESNSGIHDNSIHNSGLDSEKYKSQTNQDQLTLNAKAALLLDAASNRVLYEKNGFTELPMASTTKIMTCIVALENGIKDDVVTFSKRAASMPDVQLNAKSGQQFILKDLLYSLMLESHNDTAVAIAEHIGGSVEGFATMMNAKAKELGLEHTNFVTPNGLDSEGHYTTAYDLALLSSYAIKNEEFVSIINTPTWTFKTTDGKSEFAVSNKDRFLYMMDGSFGIKTGFTNNAGYCFVGALRADDRVYVSVVLGSGWPPHKTYKWKDTMNLMKYGIQFFTYKDLNSYKHSLPELVVIDGKKTQVPLAIEDIPLPVLMKATDQVVAEYDLPNSISAPVKKGKSVGTLRYYINDVFFKEYPIYAKEDVPAINYWYCLDEIVSRFLGFN